MLSLKLDLSVPLHRGHTGARQQWLTLTRF